MDEKQRCEGRYPVGHQRDEPFEVTYRCALMAGHTGPHGSEQSDSQPPAQASETAARLYLRLIEEIDKAGYAFSTSADAYKVWDLLRRIQKVHALASQGWQEIATAPDGPYLLLASPAHGRVIGAHVTGDCWHLIGVGVVTSKSERPTHWQPLPSPPVARAEEGAKP